MISRDILQPTFLLMLFYVLYIGRLFAKIGVECSTTNEVQGKKKKI